MNPSPQKSLERRNSVFNGINLFEVVSLKRVKALLKSPHLRMDFVKKYGVLKEYANEKEQLKEYMKLYDETLGAFKVKYFKPRHQWGRVYVNESLGLTAFGVGVRNTLTSGLYYDLDLKNAQVDILRNLCSTHSVLCSLVDDYCENREDRLREIAIHIGMPPEPTDDEFKKYRKLAKKLMLRLCFFGTWGGFCEEFNIDKQSPLFVDNFERQLKEIAEAFKGANGELYETARKLKADKGQKNFLGSFFSYYLQEHEFRIVEKVMLYLMNETEIMNHPTEKTSKKCGVYEYDGIKLLKENVDKAGGVGAVLERLNTITYERTGYRLVWEEKLIENAYDLTAELEAVEIEEKPDAELIALCESVVNGFDDVGVATLIQKILPDRFIFSNGEWFCWNGSRWENNNVALSKAITHDVAEHWKGVLQPYLDKYDALDEEDFDEMMSSNKSVKKLYETSGKLEDFIKKHLRDHIQKNKVIGECKTYMRNDELVFNENKNLLGFKNGVWDFNEEVFRPYRFNDYLTFSCGFDFKPLMNDMKYIDNDGNIRTAQDITEIEAQALDELNEVLRKIQPDDAVRDLLLVILGSGLSGKAIEKFFVFNGSGRNGKGLINEFMEFCLGDYFSYVSPLIYTESQKNKTSNGANPELAKISKKRYVVSKEPEKRSPFKNKVIKDITGGGKASARMNYSNETNVYLYLTAVVETNERPPLDEAPIPADAERFIDVLFPSFFTADASLWDETKNIYPLDTNLKEESWRAGHRNEFMNLLVSALLDLKANDYNIDHYVPESVKKRSKDYLQDSYDIHTIFVGLFEPRDETRADNYKDIRGLPSDADWTLKDIVTKVRSSTEFYELPKHKKKELSADKVKDFFRTNEYYKSKIREDTHTKKTTIVGWRLKIDEDAEEGSAVYY